MAGSSNRYCSYIIWKDYNCQGWNTLQTIKSSASTFTADQLAVINAYAFTQVDTDIWAQAHDFVEYINSHALFNTGAYSVVMGKHPGITINGYVCLVNNNYHSKGNIQTGASNYGTYFLFQTR